MNLKFICILFSCIIFFQCFVGESSINIKESDCPKILSNKIDTIEVKYIAFASECANWLPLKFIDVNPSDYSDVTIFLESKKENEIPEKYRLDSPNNRIRLIGNYYEDEGISRNYFSPTERKSSKARVFKLTSYEIIKPYLKWDDNGGQIWEK